MGEGMKEGKSGGNSRANSPPRVLIPQDGWWEKKGFTNRMSRSSRHGNSTNLLGVHKAVLLSPYADEGLAAYVKVCFHGCNSSAGPLKQVRNVLGAPKTI